MNRHTIVQQYLNEFHKTYLNPGIHPFSVIAAARKSWTNDEYKRLRAPGFPGKLRGIYLIYNSAEELQYIGLAERGSFDTRVWSHDDYIDREFTDIISLRDDEIVLAPSIESWLIDKMNPVCNKIGKNANDKKDNE